MENNNENKVFNPIARAREQANIAKAKQNSVTNPNLDVFGSSEVGQKTSTPVTPKKPVEEAIEPMILPEDIVSDTTPEKTTNTVESNNVQENLGATNTAEVNTNPTIVPEEPTKQKTQRVRVINSNDAIITPEDISESKKYAWLAYILFFIPLLINRNNEYVRHNANEGLEINLCDFIGVVLILLNTFINTSNLVGSFILLLGSIIGVGLLVLTTITKVYMIVATLLGKRANTPWFWNIRMIR